MPPAPRDPKRRRSDRREVRVPVQLYDGVDLHAAEIRNVSMDGVFLALSPPLIVGTGVSFSAVTPVGRIGLRGHVRWTRSLPGPDGEPVGVGVELYEPDDETLARLRAWIRA